MLSLIIFDWKRTLYDPEAKKLIEGATELLNYLKKKKITMVLVGKGGEDMQQEIERLGVKQFFSQAAFVEGDKDPAVFSKYIKDPKSTLFIGDRVRSELEIGNRLGVKTLWIRMGKFADEKPETEDQKPDYITKSLTDCLGLLKNNW